MRALLTVRNTAGVSGDQCFLERDLLKELASRLYDYIADADDELLRRAASAADEWERLGVLCKRGEVVEEVSV